MRRETAPVNFTFMLFTLFSQVLAKTPAILDVELVSLGTVSPLSTTSLVYIAPALEATLDEIHRNPSFSSLNISLTLLYNAALCNGNDVAYYSDQMLAKWYYQDRRKSANVTAIVLPGGPEDIYVNRLAANWNVLLLTIGSTKAAQHNKVLSPTWVATPVYSTPDAVRLYVEICGLFNWTTLFLVHDIESSPIFYTAVDAVTAEFRRLERYQLTVAGVNGSDRKDCENVLRRFSAVGRVLLFFGHAQPFRSFMILAQQMNMTSIDYVYIVLEPFHHTMLGNYTWQAFDAFDEIALLAFSSVLLLALDKAVGGPGPSEPSGIRDEWTRRTRTEFNYTYSANEMFLPHVAGARYSIYMIAKVLNATLARNYFDYGNGTALAGLLANRSFLVDGTEIVMDPQGQRQMNWSLSFFDGDSFQPFLLQDGTVQLLEQVRLINWYNTTTKLPPNEPLCGFRGTRLACQKPVDLRVTCGVPLGVLTIGFVSFVIISALRRRWSSAFDTFWWFLDDPIIDI